MQKDKKKRLVLVVPIFPKLSETFIVSKFLSLLERKWNVHVVCHQKGLLELSGFPGLQKIPDLNKQIHVDWPSNPHWMAGMLMIPALVKGFLSAPKTTWTYLTRGYKRFGLGVFKRYYLDLNLICLQPDVIHFEFGSLVVGRTYLKDLLTSKLSVSFRGYDLNFSGLDKPGYYDEVWQNIDAAHFLGNDLWQRAQKRGCPEDIPRVFIPPALDMAKFALFNAKPIEPVGLLSRPVRILSVGRLEWKKGYDFALQAVKLLIDKGYVVEYRIVGDGEYKNVLYFARHQLGLENEVEFLGSLKHEEVLKQLAWADIFLHAAVSEGFCNAVLEAQAAGLPVVCSDADGLSENVADSITGFVVPRRSSKDLAEKVAILVQDDEMRESMGRAGLDRVNQVFQLESQISAWENFYLQVL